MARMKTTLRNHFEATRFLNGQTARKLGHNTWVHGHPDGTVTVRYHRTDIIEYLPNGNIVLTTGGWQTTTTKQRLSAIIPGVRVWAERGGEWAVSSPNGADARFEDGMWIDNRGTFDAYREWRWALRYYDRRAAS